MKKIQISQKLMIVLMIISFFSCSKSSEIRSEKILGYWKAIQVSEVLKNGESSSVYEKRFYSRFFDNNCGILYDSDEKETNDIKWAYHENGKDDVLMISTALNSNGETSEFSINTIYTIEELRNKRFQTYLYERDTIDGNIFDKTHRTYYTRK